MDRLLTLAAEGDLSADAQKLLLKSQQAKRIWAKTEVDPDLALEVLKKEKDALVIKPLLTSGAPFLERLTPEHFGNFKKRSEGVLRLAAALKAAPDAWVLSLLKSAKISPGILTYASAEYWSTHQETLFYLMTEKRCWGLSGYASTYEAQLAAVKEAVKPDGDSAAKSVMHAPKVEVDRLYTEFISLPGASDHPDIEYALNPQIRTVDTSQWLLPFAMYSRDPMILHALTQSWIQQPADKRSAFMAENILHNPHLGGADLLSILQYDTEKVIAPYFYVVATSEREAVLKLLAERLKDGEVWPATWGFWDIASAISELKTDEEWIFRHLIQTGDERVVATVLEHKNCPFSAALSAPVKSLCRYYWNHAEVIEFISANVSDSEMETFSVLLEGFEGTMMELINTTKGLM